MKLSFRLRWIPGSWSGGWFVLILSLAGCQRDEVKVYSVPKETAPPPMLAPAAAPVPGNHPDIGLAAPQLTWKTPEGWTETPPGQMRVASFKITQDGRLADVSVVPLTGFGGGDVSNVNRRRGQIGLPPVAEDELKTFAQAVEIAGQPASLYDLSGKNPENNEPQRILGAIQHRDGTAWFFKMTGDDALVAQQKSALIGFLKSISFGPSSAATAPVAAPVQSSALPPGHPEMSETSAAPAKSGISAGGKPAWQVPPGWEEIPGGDFLVAKFNVPGDTGAPAAVNVSRSAGDGGGLAANVNRWRGQLGLDGLSAAEIDQLATPLEIPDGKALLVELSGTDARTGRAAKVLGAMVPRGGQTWFYKLMGDSPVVEQQKEAFIRFVQSARYSHAP